MRLMVSGGGTGGHIYPALAVIEEVKKAEPDSEIMYVGTHKGLESKIVPKQGIPFETIKIQGFKRSMSIENFKTIGLFISSVFKARKMIKKFKPDVVLGTGGYVSGAVLFAASQMGIPTLIHEQNSVVGVTNKFLSRFVTKIGISFDDAKKDFPEKKVIKTGNPRATQVTQIKSIASWKEFGLSDNKQTVLIFGGSRGAEKINQTVVESIQALGAQDYQTLIVTGNVHFQKIMEQINPDDLKENVVIKPYIDNMPEILGKLSAIVGRAGATSLAEITALGIPSILIPSPYVTNDHQTKNAMSLVNNGAAEIISEKELNSTVLMDKLNNLMNDDAYREKMAKSALNMGEPDAAQKIYQILNSIKKGN